jgi:hypothetical protein
LALRIGVSGTKAVRLSKRFISCISERGVRGEVGAIRFKL